MPNYNVRVCRTIKYFVDVVVEADNATEAKDVALIDADVSTDELEPVSDVNTISACNRIKDLVY